MDNNIWCYAESEISQVSHYKLLWLNRLDIRSSIVLIYRFVVWESVFGMAWKDMIILIQFLEIYYVCHPVPWKPSTLLNFTAYRFIERNLMEKYSNTFRWNTLDIACCTYNFSMWILNFGLSKSYERIARKGIRVNEWIYRSDGGSKTIYGTCVSIIAKF